ncbi:MAG: hypothetical protein R3A46_12525 [Thermomicrobiales bacterium]
MTRGNGDRALPRPVFVEQQMMASDPAQAMTGTSQVYFEKGFIETPFYDHFTR